MKSNKPLVTIGIPTFNRAELLKRSIESTLCQDYSMIEVIISDNASTDDTQNICQEFSKKDGRVRYVRQSSNLGATANFLEVLKRALGEYFMWLGDDDWIDVSYVSHCVLLLNENSDFSLVSGAPIYYQNGLINHYGKLFDLLNKSWVTRVAHYYAIVSDNGAFYGIMRTAQLQQPSLKNIMGGDWHFTASVVAIGKCRMSSMVSVHRELGGATISYRQIARSLELPKIQALFPMSTIAFGASERIITGAAYKGHTILARIILAVVVFLLVISKPMLGYASRLKYLFMRGSQLAVTDASSK